MVHPNNVKSIKRRSFGKLHLEENYAAHLSRNRDYDSLSAKWRKFNGPLSKQIRNRGNKNYQRLFDEYDAALYLNGATIKAVRSLLNEKSNRPDAQQLRTFRKKLGKDRVELIKKKNELIDELNIIQEGLKKMTPKD